MKRILLFLLFSPYALACPHDQYRECILPKPWGGCAQYICIPKVSNPFKDVANFLQTEAYDIALAAKNKKAAKNFDDCIPIVTAGVAAAGAKIGASGGPWGAVAGASIGAGGGVNMARLACRKWFPGEYP
jgi:hypothetical protein